ncbi:uncharacterized protein LOC135943886 [Cloeon dipterum]|uniref:uncharacterized protein LOC135943886 n=1 Tax=Cloeon dipterum TaxID=197152 RepID=UPI00321F70D5
MASKTVILLSGLLLCQLLIVAVVWGQSAVITDANPNEFPYVVKVTDQGSFIPDNTEAAGFLSKKYILASNSFSESLPSDVKVTDQSGKVRPVVRIESILGGSAVYLKVCEKFRGPTLPMTASSFNNLTADVNTTGVLLFYNASSHVLRKLPASAKSTASCPESSGGAYICMYQDSTPGFCSFLKDATPTYYNLPIIAFGTQAQGAVYDYNCDSATGGMDGMWLFLNLGYYYSYIIAAIPEVDIK